MSLRATVTGQGEVLASLDGISGRLAELAAAIEPLLPPKPGPRYNPAPAVAVVGRGPGRRGPGQGQGQAPRVGHRDLPAATTGTSRPGSATAGNSTRSASSSWTGPANCGRCCTCGPPGRAGVLSSQAEFATRFLPPSPNSWPPKRPAAGTSGHRRGGRLDGPDEPPQAREEAAHRFADAGWHVFPAEPGGKRPATIHGFLDGTTDHRQIQQWWRADPRFNVAVATGAPGPDVLDVDKHKDGDGFAAFNQLKRAGLVRDPMAIVRTPSGGFHAYYKGTNQRNGHIPGVYVDFRSQGGYVVAPPSTIAGRDYEVARKQPSADTFDWAAAKQVLDPQPERQPTSHRSGPGTGHGPGSPARLGRQPARRQPQPRPVLGLVPGRRGRRHGHPGQPRQRGPGRRAR